MIAPSTCDALSWSFAISSSSGIGTRAVPLARSFPLRAIRVSPVATDLAVAACWVSLAESVASAACSASCYDSVENISVLTVIKAERKFIQIEWQILCRHLVVAAHDSALQQTPKRFNALSVDVAAY